MVLITGANNPHGIGASAAYRNFRTHLEREFLHYFQKLPVDSNSAPPTSPGEAFYYAQQSKTPEEILSAVKDLGGDARALEANLSQPDSIPVIFDAAEEAFGPVDVLINNAAHWEGDTFVPVGQNLPNKLFETWTDRPASFTAESSTGSFRSTPEPLPWPWSSMLEGTSGAAPTRDA